MLSMDSLHTQVFCLQKKENSREIREKQNDCITILMFLNAAKNFHRVLSENSWFDLLGNSFLQKLPPRPVRPKNRPTGVGSLTAL